MMTPGNIEAVAKHFRASAGTFDQFSAIHRAIGERLMQRLDLLAIEPRRVLDLGCRTGYQLAELQKYYPEAQIIGLDPAGPAPGSSPRTRWWQAKPGRKQITLGDGHSLPFADGVFDLVVSNLFLPWCHAPHTVFAEVTRVLAPNGAFMFSSAGPDTLKEYRDLWAQIDTHWHVFGLIDMHDLGDAMLKAGFAAPVLDRENLQIDYPSINALQQELVGLGAVNSARGRRSGLMASSVRKQLEDMAPGGRFDVTFELVQGHGWKGSLSTRGHSTDEGYVVSVDSLRQSLKGG